MKAHFDTEIVITNSYIIHRHKELKEKALQDGIHTLIDFNGPIMTDSGTFQSYVYNDVDLDPQYNGAGEIERIEDVRQEVTYVADFIYDDAGNLISKTDANGPLDTLLQLTNVRWAQSSPPLSDNRQNPHEDAAVLLTFPQDLPTSAQMQNDRPAL